MRKSLEELKTMFSEYLKSHKFNRQPHLLYEPNNYILGLGGKRLRPVLVLLGCKLSGGDVKDALPAALAIEYFHNYSLIHDDIMDRAELRRGHQTLHKKYGTNEAILSGDVLMVYAYECLASYDVQLSYTLTRIMSQTAIEVCEGQSMDMSFESRKQVDEAEYLEMIRLKTSVLLAAALKMGALIGKATAEEANLLYQYGMNLGLGFQMQDDLLDTYGDEKIGKRIGGDILQNKQTLLLIHALSASESVHDDRLKHLLNGTTLSDDEKIIAVKEIYREYHSLEYVQGRRDDYVQQALNALEEINAQQEPLKLLIELLIKRQH